MACFNKSSPSFSPAKTVKIIGSELNSDHTDYAIKVIVGNFEWKVYRRYSEFLKLNDTLPPEVRDVAKQLLPKKHFFGSNSESVVKDRQSKLEIYLQCLLRSLPTMPQSLLQFLKFDVYEIHGVTESLAEHLYNKGDEIIRKNKAYGLSVVQLHAICRRMELPEPTSTGDLMRDMGHLLDFINRLKTLKVIGNREKFGLSDIEPNNLQIHFQHFKSLHSISFDNCNFEQISVNTHLRKNLRKLRVSNSLSFINEVLLAGIQWENQCNFPANVLNELSWSSLEAADFSANKIHSTDSSVSLLPRLTTLNLSRNCLEKVDFLEELPSLKQLDVSHNKLDDSSFANIQLTTITTLDISHNRIKSFSALMGLRSLSILDASFNEVEMAEELSGLGKLLSLSELKLKGNPVSTKAEYRLVVLQVFGDHFHKVTLDDEKISEKEKDAIMVRLAIQVANGNSSKPRAWKNVREGGSSKQTTSEALQHSFETPSTNYSSNHHFKTCSSVSSPNLGYVEVATPAPSEMVSEVNMNNLNSSLKECPVEKPNLENSPHNVEGCLEASGEEKQVVEEVIEKLSVAGVGDIPSFAGVEKLEKLGCSGGDLSTSKNCFNQTFSFGLQKLENNFKSSSLKQSRRRKYFLLPETLPNHNNRPLMSLLEDIMDPPDSFGLPEVEYRQNNAGHVIWCSALTNLRKSSHTQERPVCVCVTPFKIHIFKVDQLRGNAGVPKLRYFTFVLISDIHCFMIGCRHLYVRVVDRFHPSHVIVLLTFNRIKTENFLEHVKKASRRNIPFLDDYEDPVIINSSLQCERHLAEFFDNFQSDFGAGLEVVRPSQDLLQCYQLAQLSSEAETPCNFRTSAVIFTGGFFYVLFQDFAHFPKSSNNILEFIPSRSAQHRVAAVFPLTCHLLRMRQYDAETIEGSESNSEVPDFIGYGLELHFSVQQRVQVVDLRWPTSCLRREFMVRLNEAFASKLAPSLHDLQLGNLLNGDDKDSGKHLSADKRSF